MKKLNKMTLVFSWTKEVKISRCDIDSDIAVSGIPTIMQTFECILFKAILIIKT